MGRNVYIKKLCAGENFPSRKNGVENLLSQKNVIKKLDMVEEIIKMVQTNDETK